MFEIVWSLVYWIARIAQQGLHWLWPNHPHQHPKRRNILGDGVLARLKASVFLLTDNNRQDGNPIGVGFCIGHNKKAVTARHNLPANVRLGSRIRGFFGPPHTGNSLTMEITYLSVPLDLIILTIEHATFAHQSLEIDPIGPEEGDECVLAAFQISLVQQLQPDVANAHAVGICRASIMRIHQRHLVYECPSFAGDSGGALIFSDGVVIGMHIETVNQALERLGRTNSISDRLDDVERSVDSMIQGLSSGNIGVKSTLFANLVCPLPLFIFSQTFSLSITGKIKGDYDCDYAKKL